MSDYTPLQHRARLSLLDADGSLYDLTGLVLGMSREWHDGALAKGLTVHLGNADTPAGVQAQELCSLGQRFILDYSDNGAPYDANMSGVVWENAPDDQTDEFTLACWDDGIWLDSQDHWNFPAGMTGAEIITAVCTKVFALQSDPKPTVGTIAGPTAIMPAIVHDGAAKDVITSVLGHATYLGDKLYNFSVDLGVASCTIPDPSTPVYHFVDQSFYKGADKQSLKGVATQALVLGTNAKKVAPKRTPVKATKARIDRAQHVARAQFGASTVTSDAHVGGTIQVIEKGGKYQSQADADAAAATKLEETQQQDRSRMVSVAYVTPVTKGYVVHVTGRNFDGYYIVIGATFDEDALTMELNIADRGTPLWAARRIDDTRNTLISGGTSLFSATATGTVAELLAFARAQKGKFPYVWGGKSLSQGGLDCSGFTAYAFNHVGIAIGAGTGGQQSQNPVTKTPRAGDLVFWSYGVGPENQHVGIVTESGTGAIHCTQSRAGNGVVETSIAAMGTPIGYREPKGLYQ